MKIKWNWGWGILLSIIIFMAVVTTIVAFMMNREVDLVTDKYYDKEIKYQQQIDKEKRAVLLNENVKIGYTGKILNITFPSDSGITGELYFYRPSDLHKDFKIPIKLSDKSSQFLDVSTLERGLWKLQINWSADKKDFYTEKTLMLN